MLKSEAIRKAMSLEGTLTVTEVSELYECARAATGPIVEVGTDGGRSAAALVGGSMAGYDRRVYSLRDCDKTSLQSRLTSMGMASVAMPDDISHPAIDGVEVVYVGRRSWKPNGFAAQVAFGGHVITHERSMAMGEVDSDRKTWIPHGETDSLRLFSRRQCQTPYEVMLALPGLSLQWHTVTAVLALADGFHHIQTTNSGNGWDDFNSVWCRALNAYLEGKITHFVQLHSDIAPKGHWLDILLDELERLDLAMVSAIAPIKDTRGVTSTGIGDPDNPWEPWRRFTMKEVCEELPLTFTAADVGYDGYPLMHNTGCFACDLRKPLFTQTEEDGSASICFDFPTMVKKVDGKFVNFRESEDWYFSRRLHELGGESAVTRKVRLTHRGFMDFTNFEPWGKYQDGDEDTAYKWRKE